MSGVAEGAGFKCGGEVLASEWVCCSREAGG